MNQTDQAIAQAQTIKQKYELDLLKKKYVVGIGIGFKQSGGKWTDTIAIVVNVEKKVEAARLSSRDRLPDSLEGVPVDVVEVGRIRAL